MISFPLQTTTGNTEIVVLLFVSLLVAVILSFIIGTRGIRSYRGSHDRGIILLVVGILLLSGVPIAINVILTTFTAVPGWIVKTLINLIRLFGLITILVTIYDQ